VNRLIIVGAGAFGREVLDWALAVPVEKRDWMVAGFLDDRANILDGKNIPCPVLGSPETYRPQATDRFVCAIGDPGVKLRYCNMMEAKGAVFTTVVHPSVVIGSNTTIAPGSILCPGVVVTNSVKIGRHVILNFHATIGHDSILGNGCTLSPHASVSGWCALGEGVVMGCSAVIIPKISVADYTVVGAGSAVMRNTATYSTVIGVPAVQISRKEPEHG